MKGYTLIEVLIAVFLLVIILTGGTTLFFQSLRSSGLSEVDLALNSSLSESLAEIERNIRFSQVTGVASGTRLDCVSAGTNGYSGNTLTVTDLQGLTSTYSLSSNKLASTAAETGRVYYLTLNEVQVTSLSFTWYCLGSISDRLKISISATNTVLGTGLTVTRDASADIELLNSGIN